MVEPFEARTLINGKMLSKFPGKLISIMLCVEDDNGVALTAISTDKQKIHVSLPEPLGARKGNWVEIIGTPMGSEAVRAKEAILFNAEDVDFDEESYNMMVLFMNNCNDIFRQG